MFSYTVSCEFDHSALRQEWIAWLREEHVHDVLAAGALDAEVVELDPPENEGRFLCEVRYRFADRAAFEAYERDHAPRLRAEGLTRFPPERGMRYQRRTGEIVCSGSLTRTSRGPESRSR
jgi:hypothetical protein